ncbi:hypothetical protein Q0O85_19320 [Priestia megaterium]|uniref:hypothetical protein n=1 Tax=Priestia megaterium TaxID=1404 RepID=UPI00345AC19B
MLAIRRRLSNTEVFITEFVEFDSKTVEFAKRDFEYFREKGVILNSSFDDNEWILSNEASVVKFNFMYSEVSFRKEIAKGNRELGSYTNFVEAVKSFIVLKLNEYVLSRLVYICTFIRNSAKDTDFFNPLKAEKLFNRIEKAPNVVRNLFFDFLQFYPLQDTDLFIEALELNQLMLDENTNSGKDTNRRELAEFQSYFYFDKILDRFWEFFATEEEKMYYYPLYLFWKITNVLPLRTTEFTLIQKDCLRKKDNGDFILTVRRTNLKGSKKNKTIHHNIENDYVLYESLISSNVAEIIIDYQRRTEQYNSCGFLLSWEAHRDIFNRKFEENPTLRNLTSVKKILNHRVTYSTLKIIFMNFYKNIIQDKLNLKVLYKDHPLYAKDKPKVLNKEELLSPTEIMQIQLGDTRHFALINMVLNDVNPILIKDFAGHRSAEESFHYFGHIDKFVKCLAYEKFREIRKNVIDKDEMSFNDETSLANIQLQLKRKKQKYIEIDSGKCFSEKFFVGDITDCVEANNGDCFSCYYFTNDNKEYTEMLEKRRLKLEKKMNEDGNYLMRVIKEYKDTFKEQEDMRRALLNIQQSASEFLNIEEKMQSKGVK